MDNNEEAQSMTGHFAPDDQPQLSFEGAGIIALPDVTDPLDTIPLPTPSTWVDQQLVSGIALDLSTPTLDNFSNAAFDWSNSTIPTYSSMSATPEASTAAFQYPPIQSQNLYHTHELPTVTPKLVETSTYSPFHTSAPPQSKDLEPGSAQAAQSPMFSQRGITELRSVQSAVDMANKSYTSLPSRPQSSGGTGSVGRSRTDNEESPSGSEAETDPRTIHKERNRVAAAKTRRKKKSKAKEIEEHAQQVEETNTRLHQKVRTLRDTFSTLRYCALSHDPSAGCTCVGIHQYNAHMAQEVAKKL